MSAASYSRGFSMKTGDTEVSLESNGLGHNIMADIASIGLAFGFPSLVDEREPKSLII